MNAIMKPGKTSVRFECETLPPLKRHKWSSTSSEMAFYFRRLLEKHQMQFVRHLELPSVIELARQFQCCEMDIFDALLELKNHGYRHELNGIDGPIKLWDPLYRKPANIRRWRVLSQSILKPREFKTL